MLMEYLNATAGIAALINGLLLWPIVRSLKAVTTSHHTRLTRLEAVKRKRK
jgi:hypothetical protein